MMSIQTIVLFLTFTIVSVVADNSKEKVSARTLKDHFKELLRLERNNKGMLCLFENSFKIY